MTDWTRLFATRTKRMAASEIRELLRLLDQPDIISFAGGIPDPALFPTNAIADAYAAILADPKRAASALQYSLSEGYPPLRRYLAQAMTARGVDCAPENVLIVSGSQQALDFLGKLFVSPGDRILVARPTYLGALQAFNAYEPTYGDLPTAAPAPQAAKLAYVTPDFANPSGTTLTLAERHALLAATTARGLVLVEDAAYERLRYDGEPLPSLLALEAERAGGLDRGRAVYCGTFSKTIVPALRIGWVVAPRPVIDKLVLIKQASDLHTDTLGQMVILEVAQRLLDEQVALLRQTYRARRDAMLEALARHMPQGTSWTEPMGGMFVWVELPNGLDATALLPQAVREAKVAFVPGAAFFADRSGANTLRLSFSLVDPATIEDGVRRLGTLLEASP